MNFFLRRQRRPDRHTCTSREGLKFQSIALSLASLLLAASASAAPGFSNGFEDNDFGGWEITDRAGPNEIDIVGPEGTDQFPVYGNELDVLVEPYNGDLMLRMGTPKTSNETQPRGVNAISQEFEATSNSISVALRLFSLDHRGDDTLRITLTPADPNGAPVVADTFYFFNNKQGTNCTPSMEPAGTTSCEAVIDVGKRKDVIATDWQLISFSGLEAGKFYTLSIELEAGQNESLASWLYVDGGNEAPSAVINYNPKEPVEGDFVVLDCGSSVDPEGSDLTCRWKADFEGRGEQTEIAGETVVFWAAGDRTVDVTLTVSDGEKSATETRPITISDQPALVNALDVEVLAGGTVDLVCRYVDPGIDDVQPVDFNVTSGSLVDGTYRFAKENDPALASGYARVTYKAPDNPGSFTESCRVGGSSAAFQITVLDSVPDRSAALLGSIESAPIVNADQSILGNLKRPENIAVYELRDADGFKFTQGTEVVVTANFPVDYDIVLLSASADPAAKPWASAPFVSAPFVSAPFVSVPFVSAPFVSAPFVSAPFVSAPFVSAPFVSAPFVSAPFVSAPFVSAPLTQSLWRTAGFEFGSFPLSLLAGAPDGSNISGADISFGDLGALNAGSLANAQVFLKGLSANFDTNTEQVLVKIGPGEAGLYLAVLPQSGSFSAAPFNIEVEAAIPPKMSQLMPEVCQGSLLVGGGDDPDVPDAPRVARENLAALPVTPLRPGSNTLIVTQKERMMQTFNLTEEDWQAWMAGMEEFFELVDAKVISVPSEWYDYADLSPCVVDEQNQVAELIKQAIGPHMADAKYVQLMGSLDIIPPYYVPDETQTGNESLFASDLLTKPGTPLGAAISEGYMLTDAFYVDSNPQPFNGRQLYLEDISVSRLVETPDEILAKAQRFVNHDGYINLLSEAEPRSTGYDFFIDGTEAVNAILQIEGTDNTLNNDSWNAEDLRCLFFGKGEGCTKSVSNLNAINAHMSYNAGLTAKGFACQYLGDTACPDSELGEVFLSSESADILVNGVTFSIGCHSGLSVPDAWGLPGNVGLPLDPARDWVQELGTWVGSYNFAYGDTDVADRGTEGIMTLVIKNFTGGTMTLGEALVRAKWQYGAGLFEFGVYDEKSLVGLNLFGMPQARLASSLTGSSTTASAFAAGTVGANPFAEMGIKTELQPDEGKGVWFTAGDDPDARQAQAIVGRPLLPVIKPFELEPIKGTTIHGVALRGGTYTTYPNMDPVFPAQTHDLVTRIDEPQPCVETLSPSLLASVNRFDTPSGSLESLVVQPGQFRCTNGADRRNADGTTNLSYLVNGEFRIWNTLNLDPLRPIDGASDKDLKPPVVVLQDLLRIPGTDDVTATLVARDDASTDSEGNVVEASGMREIIALVYSNEETADGAGGTPGMAKGESRSASDGVPVEFILRDAFDKQLSFQYIDKAGNITAKTLKGALLRAIDVSITTSIINAGGKTEIRVRIEKFDTLVAPYLTIDYGDNTDAEVIELDEPGLCPVSSDGSCTIVILKDYGDFAGSITIKVVVRASGAIGSDETTISACNDAIGDTKVFGADIIGCSITAEDTNLTIGVVIAGALSPDVQYRLNLPQTNTQIKFSDGATTGPNKIKPTATGGVTSEGNGLVTFKFQAGKLPWNGVSPFTFKFETQSGVAAGQGQGFIDTTDVKTFTP